MSNPFKTPDGPDNFVHLLKAEKALVRSRRSAAGVPNSPVFTGIALSGGGIRSATFCLGVLQALSEKGLLPRFDYLSTVSGGSYAGSFFGALYVPPIYRAVESPPPSRPDFDKSRPLQSDLGLEAVRRLRDAGRYLTPSGTSDAFYGAAIVMRNWASVQTVIGVSLLLFFWFFRVADVVAARPLDVNIDALWYSPTLLLLVWLASVFVFAFGSSYWLTRRDWIPASRTNRVVSNLYFWMVLCIAAFCIYKFVPMLRDLYVSKVPWRGLVYLHVSAFLTVGLIAFFIAEGIWGKEKTLPGVSSTGHDRQFLIAAEDQVRSKLGDWLTTSLICFLAFAGLLILDMLGFTLLDGFATLASTIETIRDKGISFGRMGGLIVDAWPAIVAVAPPVLSYLARQSLRRRHAENAAEAAGTKLSNRMPGLLIVLGSVVVAAWIILWSAVSHVGFSRFAPSIGQSFVILAILLATNLAQSLCFSFINLSSLSTFYAARLRRAYLGASSHGNSFTSVRQDDPEDTIRVEDYYKGIVANGAPLHLVNVTIAETITGTSNLVARDRKGKPMHLSPCGIVYEGDEPGNFEAGPMHTGEELPLANWIAISGAAVAAAIGSGTSLGTSILATMANVRLGYWWKARHADKPKDLLWASLKDTVQSYLFLELRGAFDGTRRDRWYLTDGGHFENTGIYPLLQRELNFIVACDNGADPTYDMVDILRLVQRARIDLEAHIAFLGEEDLARKLGPNSPLIGAIGTFQQLAKSGDRNKPGGPVATLAEITYRKTQKTGILLLIKPRLTFTEPPELLGYHSKPGGRDFPQQTTGDQFFDEEQWEAYRRLGEYCTEKLFFRPPNREGLWLPSDLSP
ncbi:hypothetical protein EHI45_13595 [Rhizobium leguminosarum]|uniref:patatin-like phospholipase family protein n=1 Tax=Rhizobium leguminosarum TaxID=384 RepID=UPI000FEC8A3D|nr:patatin-like phospholipase family protein [Rhizobium leguminosarum]RWX14314.1 hypothetical protein EHI45_13595 [Rhizobium leguminosarum]